MSPTSRCFSPMLLAAACLAILSGPRLGFAQSHLSADELQPFVEQHALAGAVTLVASKSEILDLDTIGWADVKQQQPMQSDSLFWIASMSKPITATALMMLVEQGRVELDSPVHKYLPEFQNQWLIVEQDQQHRLLKRPSRPITVRDILSHVSGLPFKTAMQQPTLDLLPLRQEVLSYTLVPLEFDPGTQYRYSNAGLNTAGRIIEVVSGRQYEHFLDEELFRPLGMRDTTFWPSEEQTRRLAKSYRSGPQGKDLVELQIDQLSYPLNDRKHRFPMPAGGLFSTAGDVATFCRMILNDGELNGRRYLKPESVREMTSRQTPSGLAQNYGLGWQVQTDGFGHGGAYATNMTIRPQQALVLVYMVQLAGAGVRGKGCLERFHQSALKQFER